MYDKVFFKVFIFIFIFRGVHWRSLVGCCEFFWLVSVGYVQIWYGRNLCGLGKGFFWASVHRVGVLLFLFFVFFGKGFGELGGYFIFYIKI